MKGMKKGPPDLGKGKGPKGIPEAQPMFMNGPDFGKGKGMKGPPPGMPGGPPAGTAGRH